MNIKRGISAFSKPRTSEATSPTCKYDKMDISLYSRPRTCLTQLTHTYKYHNALILSNRINTLSHICEWNKLSCHSEVS
ncbi:hypothetical protein [Helicobacter sp. MIT 14-3879]|uniref:hypothetical protein n=1 Tax=Helicobacter sp. MIT 14-3879 TaxID=2040649 RepID=UPI0011C02962|nr:hypothetical protein [Helicobacter sp. MIT 14-3879]